MTKKLRFIKILFHHDLNHQLYHEKLVVRSNHINSFCFSEITNTQIKCAIKPWREDNIRTNYSTNSIPWYTYYKTLTTKEQPTITEFIESLQASETISLKDAELLKDLVESDVKVVYRDSVANRNLTRCRQIHKITLEQKDWSLAYEMFFILAAKLKLLSENENIILSKMITDSLNVAVKKSAFEFYFKLCFKFCCKLGDRHVGRLLFDLLKSGVINLDTWLELMQKEHFILSEKEANLIMDLCHRNPKLQCMPTQVKSTHTSCVRCGSKLNKDTVLQSDFNVALNDFVEKMSSFYAERDICTLYFESLKRFLLVNGPYDFCIDVENLYIDEKQFLKTIHSLPKDKRIFLILSNKSSVARVDLPSNVVSFKVSSFVFRGQDDVLTLLSVLLNGPETILISNDGYRDYIMLLEDPSRNTLQQWQRINQWPFTFDENYNTLLFPKLFSRSVQESEIGWHLPYLSEAMSRHEAGFLCLQKQSWVPSETVKQIRKARQKCLHSTGQL